MKGDILIGLAVLLVLTGCVFPGNEAETTDSGGNGDLEPQPWSVNVFMSNYEAESGGEFTGRIAVNGRTTGKLEGISLRFLNDEKELVKKVPVGDLNLSTNLETDAVNTTIPTIPTYVVAHVEFAEISHVENGQLSGQYIRSDGELRIYSISNHSQFIQNVSKP